MPPARFASPFASLSLSIDEKEQLSRTADTIVGETMAMYERFLWQDKGRLDPAVWTQLREREDTRVYHNRRPGAGTGNRDMHLLLTVGSMLGSLNDAMYGVLNPTIESFRVKTAYVEDTLVDMAVLESIVQPTPELPYESMTVRWLVKGVPLHVRLIAKHHDSVYLETTGIRQLSNGERVGIHLLHSVSFAKTPALPQYDRFNMSVCTMWRQTSSERVQGFMASYFEIKESFKTNLVIKSMADAVLSIWKVVECAKLKKLAWLVQNKSVVVGQSGVSTQAPEEGCSVCGSHDRSARRGIKSACAICSKYTCGKCRVKRHLSLFAPDGQLLKHEMRFCVPCLTSAGCLDAAAIAKDEASGASGHSRPTEDGSFHEHFAALTMSSSSSVTSSQSGDEMRFPKRRNDSDMSSQSMSKTLSLSTSPNVTRSPERSANATCTKAKTRNHTHTAKQSAKAKASSRPSKKLSEARKCGKCKKVFATHSSLVRHLKKRFPCAPQEVEKRKKAAKAAKRARNAEDYKWRRKGYTLAQARKVLNHRGPGPLPAFKPRAP